jgi:hypothetical protein
MDRSQGWVQEGPELHGIRVFFHPISRDEARQQYEREAEKQEAAAARKAGARKCCVRPNSHP